MRPTSRQRWPPGLRGARQGRVTCCNFHLKRETCLLAPSSSSSSKNRLACLVPPDLNDTVARATPGDRRPSAPIEGPGGWGFSPSHAHATRLIFESPASRPAAQDVPTHRRLCDAWDVGSDALCESAMLRKPRGAPPCHSRGHVRCKCVTAQIVRHGSWSRVLGRAC